MLLRHCGSFWDKLCFRQNPSFTAVSVTFHTDQCWLHKEQICPSHFGVLFTQKWCTGVAVYFTDEVSSYSERVLVLLHESPLKLYTKQQCVHSKMQAKFKIQPTSDCNNKKKMEWRNSNFWLNWYKFVTFRLTADLVSFFLLFFFFKLLSVVIQCYLSAKPQVSSSWCHSVSLCQQDSLPKSCQWPRLGAYWATVK